MTGSGQSSRARAVSIRVPYGYHFISDPSASLSGFYADFVSNFWGRRFRKLYPGTVPSASSSAVRIGSSGTSRRRDASSSSSSAGNPQCPSSIASLSA